MIYLNINSIWIENTHKKVNKEKPQLHRVWKPEQALSCPASIAEPIWKENDSPSFLAEGFSQWKALDSATALQTSFFPLCSSLAIQGLACGSPWLQTPNCNSLLITNKLILAVEIPGSWLILGQQCVNALISVSSLWYSGSTLQVFKVFFFLHVLFLCFLFVFGDSLAS